jgi:hypothetical protein
LILFSLKTLERMALIFTFINSFLNDRIDIKI